MGQEPGHPSATNMKKLQWSPELARVAQRWADQCPEYHDKNRRVLEFKQQPGQNMATAWNSRNDPDYELEKKIQSWYDEVCFKHYVCFVTNFERRKVIREFFGNQVENWSANDTSSWTDEGAEDFGHFTQIAWADTQYIGCGIISYKDLEQPKYPYRKVSTIFPKV